MAAGNCQICGRELKPHDQCLPDDAAMDCGGDCYGCVYDSTGPDPDYGPEPREYDEFRSVMQLTHPLLWKLLWPARWAVDLAFKREIRAGKVSGLTGVFERRGRPLRNDS